MCNDGVRRTMVARLRWFITAAVLAGWFAPAGAEQVAVRHPEASLQAPLRLGTLDGRPIADGDLTQGVQGDRVTARLVFRFKDGSLHDEVTVYPQRGTFRLVSDRVVQRGPSFPRPLTMSLDVASGRVTVEYADGNGHPARVLEQLDLPADVANGIIVPLLKNVRPDSPPTRFSFVAATPKPRLVGLEIADAGTERVTAGGAVREARHYVLKANIGGISGLLAPLVGKQPPDSHVWILDGDAPAFVKAEQPLYAGGPLWRIEAVQPAGPE